MIKRILPFIVISLVMLAFWPLLRAHGVIVAISSGFSAPTASPTGAAPSPFATPTALASPVIVIAGGQHVKNTLNTNVGTSTTFGNGTTDDTAAFNDALNSQGSTSLLILGNNECTGTPNSTSFVSGSVSGDNSCCTGNKTGTCNPSGGYLITTQTNIGNGIHTANANANIRCGDGTGRENSTVYFKMPGTPTGTILDPGNWRMMSFDSSGSIFGCGFRGPQYNSTSPGFPGCCGGNQMFIWFRNDNDQASNNDFNGVGGSNGAINTESTAGGLETINYNSFENCGGYGVQVSLTNPTPTNDRITIDHNSFTDCDCCVEGTFNSPPVITLSNNTHTYIHNNGGFNFNGNGNHILMHREGGSGGTAGTSDFHLSSMINDTCTTQPPATTANIYGSCSTTQIPFCDSSYTSSNITATGGCVKHP